MDDGWRPKGALPRTTDRPAEDHHFLLFTSPDKVLGTVVPFLDVPPSEPNKATALE